MLTCGKHSENHFIQRTPPSKGNTLHDLGIKWGLHWGKYLNKRIFLKKAPGSLEQIWVLVTVWAFNATKKPNRSQVVQNHLQMDKLDVSNCPRLSFLRSEYIALVEAWMSFKDVLKQNWAGNSRRLAWYFFKTQTRKYKGNDPDHSYEFGKTLLTLCLQS